MEAHSADRSIRGKLRRRLARLQERRPARVALERPMVSLSFDDAPQSAAYKGAAILQSRGLRGTYFISAGLAGEDGPMGRNATVKDIAVLSAAGHEVACHTFSHLDCGQADGPTIAADVARNTAALESLGLPEPVTFAYPYGDVSVAAKKALGGRFALLRALHHGLIEDGTDLNQAPAVGVEGPVQQSLQRSGLRAPGRRGVAHVVGVEDQPAAPFDGALQPG